VPIPGDSPISIVVEGTTLESTDVDTVPELGKSSNRNRRQKDSSEEATVPVTRRIGGDGSRARPTSDGHILSQQAYLLKVPFFLCIYKYS